MPIHTKGKGKKKKRKNNSILHLSGAFEEVGLTLELHVCVSASLSRLGTP